MRIVYDVKTKNIYGPYSLCIGKAETMEDFFEEHPDGQAIDGWETYYLKDIKPCIENRKRKTVLTFEP